MSMIPGDLSFCVGRGVEKNKATRENQREPFLFRAETRTKRRKKREKWHHIGEKGYGWWYFYEDETQSLGRPDSLGEWLGGERRNHSNGSLPGGEELEKVGTSEIKISSLTGKRDLVGEGLYYFEASTFRHEGRKLRCVLAGEATRCPFQESRGGS